MANTRSTLKPAIIAAIRAALKSEFDSYQNASLQTRQSGSDDESRADGKYDTQSTEANYLADGQARQAEEIAQAAATYAAMESRDFKVFHSVDIGALIELDIQQQSQWFFLGPASGGLEIEVEQQTITVITPDSPLGQQLIGRHTGDHISSPKAEILSIT